MNDKSPEWVTDGSGPPREIHPDGFQRIIDLEDALAASEARVAELVDDGVNHHEFVTMALTRNKKLTADCRQLAEAVIKAHPYVEYINGFLWERKPCDCPACQTARRVLE